MRFVIQDYSTYFRIPKKRLTEFDRLAVFDVDLDDLARNLGLDLIHQLHRLNDANDDPEKPCCLRLHTDLCPARRAVKCSDNRRCDR
jgi:hypothetical protein